MSFEAMHAYCIMRGLVPGEVFDWFCLADAETVAWMAEETEKERKAERHRAQLESQAGRMPRR